LEDRYNGRGSVWARLLLGYGYLTSCLIIFGWFSLPDQSPLEAWLARLM
jgi:hypothetical protein